MEKCVRISLFTCSQPPSLDWNIQKNRKKKKENKQINETKWKQVHNSISLLSRLWPFAFFLKAGNYTSPYLYT